MRWKRYGITMDITGISKKFAAQMIADQFGTSFQYDSEKDIYIISDPIDRKWKIEAANGIDAEKIQGSKRIRTGYIFQVKMHTPLLYENDFEELAAILTKMKAESVLTNHTTKMDVQIEATDLQNKYLENLEKIGKGKGELLSKALGSSYSFFADASMLEPDGIVIFPLFYSSLEPEVVKSNIQLVQGIHQFANKNNAISEKVNLSPNDKFVFRTWMVRLGMVGDEFKFARKMFTQDLCGNSAWLHKVEINEELEQSQEEPTQDKPKEQEVVPEAEVIEELSEPTQEEPEEQEIVSEAEVIEKQAEPTQEEPEEEEVVQEAEGIEEQAEPTQEESEEQEVVSEAEGIEEQAEPAQDEPEAQGIEEPSEPTQEDAEEQEVVSEAQVIEEQADQDTEGEDQGFHMGFF